MDFENRPARESLNIIDLRDGDTPYAEAKAIIVAAFCSIRDMPGAPTQMKNYANNVLQEIQAHPAVSPQNLSMLAKDLKWSFSESGEFADLWRLQHTREPGGKQTFEGDLTAYGVERSNVSLDLDRAESNLQGIIGSEYSMREELGRIHRRSQGIERLDIFESDAERNETLKGIFPKMVP